MYVHFFDWFSSPAWDEDTFVERFDWDAIGTSLDAKGTVDFYERQFAYIRSLGIDGVAWEFHAMRNGDYNRPSAEAVEAARRVGLKIVPFYDLEITLQVHARLSTITPTLATPGAITATQATIDMFSRELGMFYDRVPSDIRGEDADGAAPIFTFGFGFDNARLDPEAWHQFAVGLTQALTAVIGPAFRLYWSATNSPMQEHLFQHHRDHVVPFHFVSDNPQSQWAPGCVTLNFGFDNLGVQRRDGLLRVVRVDPRYLEEAAWIAASTQPAVIFLYGWNEPFEGSILFPTVVSGDRKARAARFVLEQIRGGLQLLPTTLIIADDLDALYAERAGHWHLEALREMMLYRMRLFAPQADVVMPHEVTAGILERYACVVDLASRKTEALVDAVWDAATGGKRVMVFDPLARFAGTSYAPRFFESTESHVINAEVEIDGGGPLFIRDDVYSGRLRAGCNVMMQATRDGVLLPLVVVQGNAIFVNSYTNSDAVMTCAFASLYGRKMERSILYGEALASQRLEISPEGGVFRNTLSRGSVNLRLPLPRDIDWNVPPPDVAPEHHDFALGAASGDH